MFCSGWPETCYVGLAGFKLQRYLYLLCAGTKDMDHHTLPSLYLRQYLSMNMKFTMSARQTGQGTLRSVCLCPSTAEISGIYRCTWLLCGCWGPKPSLRACKAGTS